MHADDPQRVPAEVSQEVSQAEALDDVFRQERAARIAAAQ